MEKLRRQLEKEERRIAKAEARASKARSQSDKIDQPSLQKQTDANRNAINEGANVIGTSIEESSQIKVELRTLARPDEGSLLKQEDASYISLNLGEIPRTTTASDLIGEKIVETQGTVPDPLTPTSQPSLPDRDASQKSVPQPSASSRLPNPTEPHIQAFTNRFIPEADDQVEDSSLSTSTITSDDSELSISTDSDSEDSTSSSGSSSSDAPEIAPSTRTGPDRVPPPKKVNKQKAICRSFLRGSRCKHGDACTYRHELPERGSQAAKKRKEGKRAEVRTERKGLYERVREA